MNTQNAMTVDLEAIRERLAVVAHLGTDWTYIDDPKNHNWLVAYDMNTPGAGLAATVPDYGEHIADLIANAPKDLTSLLAAVDHLMAKHAEVQALSMRRGEEIARLRGELKAKA